MITTPSYEELLAAATVLDGCECSWLSEHETSNVSDWLRKLAATSAESEFYGRCAKLKLTREQANELRKLAKELK